MKAARITLHPSRGENSNRDRESNAQYPVSVNSTTFVRAPAIDCSKENPHLGINSCSPAGGGVASRALALSPGPSLLSSLSSIRHGFIPWASTIPFWIEPARAKAEGSFLPNTSLFRHYLKYHRAPRWNGPADRVSSPQRDKRIRVTLSLTKKSAIRLVVSSLYNILYSQFTGKAAGSLAPLELEQTGVESRSIQYESPALPARERRSLTRKRSFLHQRMGNGGSPYCISLII